MKLCKPEATARNLTHCKAAPSRPEAGTVSLYSECYNYRFDVAVSSVARGSVYTPVSAYGANAEIRPGYGLWPYQGHSDGAQILLVADSRYCLAGRGMGLVKSIKPGRLRRVTATLKTGFFIGHFLSPSCPYGHRRKLNLTKRVQMYCVSLAFMRKYVIR